MLTESQFEIKYNKVICRQRDDEEVSFSSALQILFDQYKLLDGDEDKFHQLLIDWELIKR